MGGSATLIVGELINSTRKQIQPLLESRDAGAIVDLARRQVEAGAHLVDVNCATLMEDEVPAMEWAVRTIQGALDVRLSIDSPNPKALRRGLEVHRGRALLDSINLEQDRWKDLIPVIREFRPEVVALCMDDQGIPSTASGKLECAARLIDGLTDAGVPPEDILVDPLLFPIATDSRCVVVFLEALDLIKERYPGVRTICGLSNVSFGLPHRAQINQVFLVLCLAHGMDAFILDPLDRRLMANLTTAQMLLGQDEYCRRYLAAVRAGTFNFATPRAGGGDPRSSG
ncbi:MAG: dihydropteroate synthase [Armatimonadota bacterium]|nr:dihydropteroate synthase [Armatimonadota bacterium]